MNNFYIYIYIYIYIYMNFWVVGSKSERNIFK